MTLLPKHPIVVALVDSPAWSAVLSLMLAMAVSLVTTAIVFGLAASGPNGLRYGEEFDAAITALLFAALFYGTLAVARRRRRRFLRELEQIAELNHYVRNALQVIVYQVALSRQEKEATERILQAVSAITETLERVLPVSDAARKAPHAVSAGAQAQRLG